jgi:Helix-turn-helix domain
VWRDAVRDSPLRSTTKLVGVILSTWADARGGCFPGRSTIAAGASVSDRAVDKALDELEREGWLAIDPPKRPVATKAGGTVLRRPGGREITNTYKLLLGETAHVIRTSEWERANDGHLKSERGAVKSEHGSHESAESAESVGGGRLNGAAPPQIDESCERCGSSPSRVVDGRVLCAPCTEVLA